MSSQAETRYTIIYADKENGCKYRSGTTTDEATALRNLLHYANVPEFYHVQLEVSTVKVYNFG